MMPQPKKHTAFSRKPTQNDRAELQENINLAMCQDIQCNSVVKKREKVSVDPRVSSKLIYGQTRAQREG